MNVSIITPSLNSEKYIEENLKSVHSQRIDGDFSLEQIIIDGNSTDRTIEIIKNFRDTHNANIKIIQGKDKNMYDAINKGLKAMSGDIWACLNTDDIYNQGAINSVLKEFLKNPDVDVVYGYLDVIDERGDFLNTIYLPKFDMDYFVLKADCFIIIQPATFMRKNVLDKAGYFDINYNYSSDYEYFIRVASRCKMKLIGKNLTQFRQHENSITFNKDTRSVQMKESHLISKKYIDELKIEQKCLLFGNLRFYAKQFKLRNSKYIAKKINQIIVGGTLAEFVREKILD